MAAVHGADQKAGWQTGGCCEPPVLDVYFNDENAFYFYVFKLHSSRRSELSHITYFFLQSQCWAT